jgi:hypothetical protein
MELAAAYTAQARAASLIVAVNCRHQHCSHQRRITAMQPMSHCGHQLQPAATSWWLQH